MDEEVYSHPAIDKRALKGLARRSDARGLAQFLWHLACLAATGLLVWRTAGTPWLVLSLPLHGLVTIFLFAPLHETIHRTAFKSRWLNDSVAWVSGAVLLLPPEFFRAFHFAHHRHTQDPELDPELVGPPTNTLGRYLWRISGLAYWRERVRTTLRLALTGRITEPFIPVRQQAAVVREARRLLLFYGLLAAASLALQSWALVLYWVLPVLIGQPFLRLYLIAEHGACPLVPDMLKNSRTTRSNALMRRLAWNMPFHAEHHAYPALPFHALPAAHGLLAEHIAVQSPGYIAANRDILVGILGKREVMGTDPNVPPG
jgi:fatty acid desaturase